MSFRFLLQPTMAAHRRHPRRHQGRAGPAARPIFWTILRDPGQARRAACAKACSRRRASSCSASAWTRSTSGGCSETFYPGEALLDRDPARRRPVLPAARTGRAVIARRLDHPLVRQREVMPWSPHDRKASRHRAIRSGPDLGRAVVAAHGHVVPAHAHERRPHADVGDPHLAVADQLRLHDLPGVREAAGRRNHRPCRRAAQFRRHAGRARHRDARRRHRLSRAVHGRPARTSARP